MLSDWANSEPEVVTVDEQIVEIALFQRRAEPVIRLKDGAEDSAYVLRVQAEYLVADDHVEHLA